MIVQQKHQKTNGNDREFELIWFGFRNKNHEEWKRLSHKEIIKCNDYERSLYNIHERTFMAILQRKARSLGMLYLQRKGEEDRRGKGL